MAQKFYCEIERSDGLAVLSDGLYIYDADEMLKIAKEIIYTAENYREAINSWNNEVENKTNKKKEINRVNYRLVYLLSCGSFYKIGVTNDLGRRIKQLDERPYKINVIKVSKPLENAFNVEKRLHKIFKSKIIKGEWFNLNKNDVTFIVSYLSKLGGVYD